MHSGIAAMLRSVQEVAGYLELCCQISAYSSRLTACVNILPDPYVHTDMSEWPQIKNLAGSFQLYVTHDVTWASLGLTSACACQTR